MKSDLESQLWDQINFHKLPLPEREYRFCGRRWRFDFAWKPVLLAVEVQGGIWARGGMAHSRGTGIERDCEKLATAASRGWRVMPVTEKMINDGRAIELIKQALK